MTVVEDASPEPGFLVANLMPQIMRRTAATAARPSTTNLTVGVTTSRRRGRSVPGPCSNNQAASSGAS